MLPLKCPDRGGSDHCPQHFIKRKKHPRFCFLFHQTMYFKNTRLAPRGSYSLVYFFSKNTLLWEDTFTKQPMTLSFKIKRDGFRPDMKGLCFANVLRERAHGGARAPPTGQSRSVPSSLSREQSWRLEMRFQTSEATELHKRWQVPTRYTPAWLRPAECMVLRPQTEVKSSTWSSMRTEISGSVWDPCWVWTEMFLTVGCGWSWCACHLLWEALQHLRVPFLKKSRCLPFKHITLLGF